uniref:Uncharacterized protein n=1 Tax=Pyramimonas orientalis virus TaxID=455367 RepID=A0A7M3UNS9_POV01|nr:hypothetical protein HWQ62_00225 [Pyramimonas orientalis virus]
MNNLLYPIEITCKNIIILCVESHLNITNIFDEIEVCATYLTI